jgi:8-oxo-dGTP pyrophosphatase MutT (NUDIX family)
MKAELAFPRPSAVRKVIGIQYAALPYRVVGGVPQILLITSRRTRRWIVPKGWPVDGLHPRDCAAMEALEEAGVCGELSEDSIGSFRYVKHSKKGISVPCTVEVFALRVTQQRRSWAEKHQRDRRWHTIDEAASAVEEPMLRLLILQLGDQLTEASNPA